MRLIHTFFYNQYIILQVANSLLASIRVYWNLEEAQLVEKCYRAAHFLLLLIK